MEVWKVDGKVSISESRCFSFQVGVINAWRVHGILSRFNLGIEMLFISRSPSSSMPMYIMLWFQSRNRDAFHFKDARHKVDQTAWQRLCFNLGIEMLFVSSSLTVAAALALTGSVSISESRCFSFQAARDDDTDARQESRVSISESRCFSFQEIHTETE